MDRDMNLKIYNLNLKRVKKKKKKMGMTKGIRR